MTIVNMSLRIPSRDFIHAVLMLPFHVRLRLHTNLPLTKKLPKH